MLTLHHAPQSRSSRIIWLLEEIGATYQIVLTDIPRPDGSGASDPKDPHPDKKVPALVDDGVLVTESAAIVLYLTDKSPGAGVGPVVGDPLRGPYFSLASFTTLGATELTLPPAHRMVGAFESAAGMMMFGWSTALLVAVLSAPTAGRGPRGACSCEQRCRP